MALVTQSERQAIAACIAAVENRTDAELVTVLVARSDDYRYVSILWAALGALLAPSLFLIAGSDAGTIIAGQLATFCVLALLFRAPGVVHRLIPRSTRAWRAANMARRQFLEQGLHHTANATGVLLFVSEAEHYVEIIVDRGIQERVPDARWDAIVDEFIEAVRAGDTLRGFERALTRCGDVLAEAVPKTPGNTDELANRLVVIGYD